MTFICIEVRVFSFAAIGFLATTATAAPSTIATTDDDARRLAAILDYVAGDYGGAVDDGLIANSDEYAEQLGFLADAAVLASRLPPAAIDATAGVEALIVEVRGVEAPDRVSADARALRRSVLDAYGVSVAPTSAPRYAPGQSLYADNCASCHGTGGGADTAIARTLQPSPRNFLDDAVMTQLTPTRAFNALTDGVAGTAMPSFPQLSPSQRWDLAFYVFTLRFDAEDAASARPPELLDITIANLADSNEREFVVAVADKERGATRAWLRRNAPYETTGVTLDLARSGLAAGMDAWRAGDFEVARQTIGEAYLSGFEPHEAALRTKDAALVAEIETSFLALRNEVGVGGAAEGEAARLQALLDRAEESLAGGSSAAAAFIGAALVVLREGVEAALLILMILGLDRKGNGASRAAAVHSGWVAALLAGGVTWWLSDRALQLTGASREWMEGVVALVAAVAMVTASHWMLARADSKRRVDAVIARFGAGPVGSGTLALVSFTAVYREAFEVVLFLKAIALDAGNRLGPILAGTAAALALLVVFVAVALRLGRRLKPAPLLTGAGLLLCLMSVVFVGKGVRALQEAGSVAIHPFDGPRFDLVGVFPTWETAAAQTLLVLVLVATVVPWRRLASGFAPPRSPEPMSAAEREAR